MGEVIVTGADLEGGTEALCPLELPEPDGEVPSQPLPPLGSHGAHFARKAATIFLQPRDVSVAAIRARGNWKQSQEVDRYLSAPIKNDQLAHPKRQMEHQ